MSEPESSSRLWYVRRKPVVRGPYPPGQISREILLGRIRDDDELSHDQAHWKPLAALPHLIPEVMRNADSPQGRQRLMLARLREDERMHDRRGGPAHHQNSSERRAGDRRNVESLEVVNRRDTRVRWAEEAPAEDRNYLVPAAVIFTVILILVMTFVLYRPAPTGSSRNCEAPPAPAVNWNGCSLLGRQLAGVNLRDADLGNVQLLSANLDSANLTRADLRYADLSGARLTRATLRGANGVGAILRGVDLVQADLRDADLEFADFQSATISGTQLAGARLGKAIWIDGRICAVDSVGACH